MKNTIIKFSLFCTMLGLVSSCSKKIDEVYQNPNAPTRVPVESLLPNIVASMAGNYAGHGPMNDIRYVGAYVQNFAFYLPLSNYDQMGYTNSAADVGQSTWRMHYYDIGQNAIKMVEWAEEEKKWDYAGVGKGVLAWSWLTLTDYYGDVILKEAFKTELITFKYDTQEDVYNHVRQLCFEALASLNKTGDGVSQANLAKGDAYFYNGDVNKWKKFVYGVLARYHNHLSNKASYKADSAIYYANLAMTDNADNAMVKFQANALSATNNFFGPFRGNLTGTGVTAPTAIRQASFSANLVNGTNAEFAGVQDPRGWYILRGNTAGTIKGVDINKGQAVLAANDRPENFWGSSQAGASAVNTAPATDANCRYIFRNSAPFPVMTASEMKFIVAEAAFRKGDKALAYQAYKDGISLSFDMLSGTYNVNIPTGKDINATNKAAYLANTAVVPATSAALTMSKIMLQKYIAMYAWGTLETWVDMRRFHYTDSYGGQPVYTGFVKPTGGDLFPDNAGNPVYRVRPRFNSEYVWNILELGRIGATKNDYHTLETWFSKP
jgi:Starch-binding associating with outer membrane